jgi:glycosyltransferase involved in cell wall biosynthesis
MDLGWSAMSRNSLAVVPAVPVWTRDGDQLVFDRKFFDGMLAYCKEWQGSVSCVMRESDGPEPPFGTISPARREIPFDLKVLRLGERVAASHLAGASVVLASGDTFDQLHVARLCNRHQIRCVYVIEYIPETRHQIVELENCNWLIKLRRHFFLWNGERRRVAAFKAADGLQANGCPAYYEYGWHKSRLLYFDTRIYKDLIISDAELSNRVAQMEKAGPLRLAFSGRLIRMKGADHLIDLACELKRRNVPFSLTIFGAGELESEIKSRVAELDLADEVFLPGALDFYRELIPAIKQNVDLYVVLHRQSDPSCTYLETLSCGIPIVGYGNRAFSGLLEQADIGWQASVGDVNGIADIVQRLEGNRELIRQKSVNAVGFSRNHDFETTFQRRVAQLAAIGVGQAE